ncbi:MAG: hypothetical protein HY788_17170 [Deltaproteobacteria bacterium]|nr:hypothetical protein [Deltaproteobacteria bacterium]
MNDRATIPRACVIAGTHSGVGKTTLALGLMAAARQQGMNRRHG